MEQPKKSINRYCIVPKCRNTVRSAPNKVFFLVPRGADIRRKWCKIMKRDMVSPSSCLYCCEDHFDVEEDTYNYMEYKIMNLQENQNTILRLKKDILPHKFQCQEDTESQLRLVKQGLLKRKHLEIIEGVLSAPPAKQCISDSSLENYSEADTSLSSCHMYKEDTENENVSESGCSTSLSNVYSKNKMHVDKAIQVTSKIYYRNKSVGVNWSEKTKSTVSQLPIHFKTTSTFSLKIAHETGIKRELFQGNADVASLSSIKPTLSTTSFEPDTSSPRKSLIILDDVEKEKQFQNQMRSCMLKAIEKEPNIFLGLPKRLYYLIKLLCENIPLPTIDILITLKKIKLNESFSILALQFGYTQSTISTIFSKTVLLLAEKMKHLIVWPTPEEISNHLPISFSATYSNVFSIINCLEIQIEKPSNGFIQSPAWSQFKNCNTIKYLISCTPDGLVNFISNGYHGRATDVMIVEDCGFLDCLPSKTAIMADRGFKDLSLLLEKKDCTLIRPPIVFNSSASSKEDIEESRKIAALRIHVDCVINRLREFDMLLPQVCVDHNLIPILDDVIVVVCGLINMQYL